MGRPIPAWTWKHTPEAHPRSPISIHPRRIPMRAIDFTPAQAKPWAAALSTPLDFQAPASAPAVDFHVAEAAAPLHLRVLRTGRQREELATLRKHAPMGVEDDLGAGLMPYESLRDDMGFVTA